AGRDCPLFVSYSYNNGPPPARRPGPVPSLPPGTNLGTIHGCQSLPPASPRRGTEKGPGMPRAQRKIGEILVDLGVLKGVDVGRVLDALSRRLDRQKFGQ